MGNKKIRLGMLGAGRIVERVMADMHRLDNVEITAIAARDLSRAQEAADRYGIPHAYGSYLELAQSNEVDLVYIATPHPFHAEQSILMMNHGKHVICEKPMAINHHEVQQMIDCAKENNVFLMEAMWTRFLPCVQQAVRMVKDGVIGEVKNVFGEFSWHAQEYDPEDRVFKLELAGGGLLDLGVYPLMLCMQFLGSNPEKVQSLCRKSKEGIDMNMSVQMQYSSGAVAQFFCGMDACGNEYMQIFGTKGYISMPACWHPKEFTLCLDGQKEQLFTFEHQGDEAYHYEFDHAAECILQGMKESPVMPLEESLVAARICTDIRFEHGIIYPGDKE